MTLCAVHLVLSKRKKIQIKSMLKRAVFLFECRKSQVYLFYLKLLFWREYLQAVAYKQIGSKIRRKIHSVINGHFVDKLFIVEDLDIWSSFISFYIKTIQFNLISRNHVVENNVHIFIPNPFSVDFTYNFLKRNYFFISSF